MEHITLTGDRSGEYVLVEERSDDSLVVAPDTSIEAIRNRAGARAMTPQEFEEHFGDLPSDVPDMRVGMDEAQRRERLEALFRAHSEAVHAYARRRVDAASAEDAVGEVFAIACRRLEDVPESPLPWLLACARRVLANQRRGVRRTGALRLRPRLVSLLFFLGAGYW